MQPYVRRAQSTEWIGGSGGHDGPSLDLLPVRSGNGDVAHSRVRVDESLAAFCVAVRIAEEELKCERSIRKNMLPDFVCVSNIWQFQSV